MKSSLLLLVVTGLLLPDTHAQTNATLRWENVLVTDCSEQNQPAILTVLRSGDLSGPVSVDYFTMPGTAQPGSDYTAVSGSLTFTANQARQTVAIPIVNDTIVEPTETFSVILTNASPGAIIEEPRRALVQIQDGDPYFALWGNTGYQEGSMAEVNITIENGWSLSKPVTVDYTTQPGSASEDIDFTPVRGTLTFKPNEDQKTISIRLLDDSIVNGNRDFTLVLSNPTDGVGLGSQSQITLTIVDYERGYSVFTESQNGLLYLPEKAEDEQGPPKVWVHRGGDFGFASSVNYQVVAKSPISGAVGTATPGIDFIAVSGTLNFAPGKNDHELTVPILDDQLVEGDESFFIVLSDPTGGVPVATPETKVVILDDEPNPVRVDPDFKPDLPGSKLIQVDKGGRILAVTPANRLNGEDGEAVIRLLPSGTLDPSWKTAMVRDSVSALALQTNGQVLVACQNSSDFPASVQGTPVNHLARLNDDGSLDTNFLARIPAPDLVVTALAVAPDGMILAGVSGGLFRLNSDGSCDDVIPLTGREVKQILPTPDGSILITDTIIGTSIWPDFVLRLQNDGTIDREFELRGGLVTLQPDGRLLLTQSDSQGCWLRRFLPNGRLDPGFTAFQTRPWALYAPSATDGKIWVLLEPSYTRPQQWRLARLNADGTPDPTWLAGWVQGTFVIDFLPRIPATTLRPLPDSNLLLVSSGFRFWGPVNGQPRPGLAKLLPNAPTPRLEVDAASAQIPENGGKVPVTLIRCGALTQPLAVSWKTEGGTAKPGLDYLPANGTLTFATNQSQVQIELQILDNAIPDNDRTMRLGLQTVGANPVSLPPVELTIRNDDLGFLPGGITAFSNGRVLLRITGAPEDQSVLIQYSFDLLHNWTDWQQVWPDTSGRIEYVDDQLDNGPRLFYRLKTSGP